MWRPAPQQRRFQAPGKYLYSVAFSPDDRLRVAAGTDDTITIWETATGREIDASPLKHRGLIYSVGVQPGRSVLGLGRLGSDRAHLGYDFLEASAGR